MSAIISPDGLYRYRLGREVPQLPRAKGGTMVFCMLNPSTADAEVNDPTIRRCIDFAQREGRRELVVVNLYAFRTPYPEELKLAKDPVGPENVDHIIDAARLGRSIVCAWGTKADPGRVAAMVQAFKIDNIKMLCLGTTKDGHPRHPLYVKKDQPLIPWSPR